MKRILVALSLFLFLPLTAAAQMNELGVFISTSQFDDSEIEDAGDVFDVDFDEDMGFGVSYNRFWTNAFSTELAYQRIGADLTLGFEDVVEQIGDLDLDILSATAQLHFARRGFLSPYIGGGVAFISAELGGIDDDEIEAADLEDEIEFLANAGLNLNLGRGFAIFLDGKYILYELRGRGDTDDEAVEINPLIIAGGIKLRF